MRNFFRCTAWARGGGFAVRWKSLSRRWPGVAMVGDRRRRRRPGGCSGRDAGPQDWVIASSAISPSCANAQRGTQQQRAFSAVPGGRCCDRVLIDRRACGERRARPRIGHPRGRRPAVRSPTASRAHSVRRRARRRRAAHRATAHARTRPAHARPRSTARASVTNWCR